MIDTRDDPFYPIVHLFGCFVTSMWGKNSL